MEKFKNDLLKFTNAFQSNKYIKAVTNAMMGVMPIMMISSVASLILAINIGPSQAWMESIGLLSLLNQVNAMTIDVVSLYIAFLVAYKLGEIFETDQLTSGIIGIMSFLILTPLGAEETLALSALGSGGMFVAMFGGLLGGRLYIFFVQHKVIIKMPDSVPTIVSKSFASIVPGVIVAVAMGIIGLLITFTGYASLSELLFAIIQTPLTALGANIWACMFIVAFIELLWFFGIHGVLAVYPIIMLVFQEPQMANLAAYGAGQVLPYLFTTGFLLNNRGARSLAVSILCIFNTKSQRLKAVGKVGLVPACFGISEPIKFGIPQVMNIRMLAPLMITPAVSVLSAYLLTISGFLGYQNGINIPTGFPVIFGGFLTNGWQGIVAQLLQLGLCVLIYIPFIKSQDKDYYAEEVAIKEAKEKEVSIA